MGAERALLAVDAIDQGPGEAHASGNPVPGLAKEQAAMKGGDDG
jgi:hypothetical protein